VQFTEVFKRNFKFLLREKKALAGIVFNSLAIGLLVLAVFFNIGDFPDLKAIIGPNPTPESIKKAETTLMTYV
jgi:hypothetical protein